MFYMSFCSSLVFLLFSRFALTLSSHLVRFNFPLLHSLLCVLILYWDWQHPGLLLELFELMDNSDPLGLTGDSSQCLISSIHFPPHPQHSDVAMVKNINMNTSLWERLVWSSLLSPAGLMSTLRHRSHSSGLIHCAQTEVWMELQPSVPVYNLLLSGDGREPCHSMIKINGDRKSLLLAQPRQKSLESSSDSFLIVCFSFWIYLGLFFCCLTPHRHNMHHPVTHCMQRVTGGKKRLSHQSSLGNFCWTFLHIALFWQSWLGFIWRFYLSFHTDFCPHIHPSGSNRKKNIYIVGTSQPAATPPG